MSNSLILSATLQTYLRGNLLSSSLETKVILMSESKRIYKSCCTNCMQSFRMHKLFCNSLCIVKNKTMFSILSFDSTLFIASDSQSHNIEYFNKSDLFTKSLKFMRICREVLYHYLIVTSKTVKLSLFLTCTCDYFFINCKL